LKRASEKFVEGINTYLYDILSSQKFCNLQDSHKEYGTLREAKKVVNKLNMTGHHIGAICMPDN
jgi:hypothetical protein